MNSDPAQHVRITIVMITHNRCEELCRSLTHLQALPERPAIVVVDNASTDSTADQLRARFRDIKLIRSDRNRGAAGRNLGVEHVRTPYVAFSDDDTWWEAGSLATATAMLDEHKRIAVLNGSILVGPENRPDPACVAMAASPLPAIAGVGPLLTGFMAGACVMRTDVFRKAGGYWPRFFIGSEESLLAMDILDAGHHIAYAPALTVHHWPSQHRDSDRRIMLTERNAIWSAWLRLPPELAWRRTRAALGSTTHLKQRARLAVSVIPGIPAVLMNRRRLRPLTTALLERVRNHERVVKV